jgi:creatinine amidohydrolase
MKIYMLISMLSIMVAWNLQESTLKDVKESRFEVAVLPVGSTEPHGLHLPYGMDFYQAKAVSEMACEKAAEVGAKVVMLPAIPYGSNRNSLGFPMTISLDQSTLNMVVRDIVESLEHHGVKKLVILNGHGGNDFTPLMRDLYGRTRVFIVTVDWWRTVDDVRSMIIDEPGEHADEFETSIGLALFPHLVRMEEAEEGAVNTPKVKSLSYAWARFTRPWHVLTRNSGFGNPLKSSREKGEKILEAAVERIARLLKELSDAEMAEGFPY